MKFKNDFYAAPRCEISTDVSEDILCSSTTTQAGSTENLDPLDEFTW